MTENQETNEPMSYQSAIDHKLDELLKATNIEINSQVFRILIDLLRTGCTSEAIFEMLAKVSSHSTLVKRFKRNVNKHKLMEESGLELDIE